MSAHQEKISDNKAHKPSDQGNTARFTSYSVYFCILLGCIVCLAAYYALSLFVYDVQARENERVTKQFIYLSYENAQNIKGAVRSVAGQVSAGASTPQAATALYQGDIFYYVGLYDHDVSILADLSQSSLSPEVDRTLLEEAMQQVLKLDQLFNNLRNAEPFIVVDKTLATFFTASSNNGVDQAPLIFVQPVVLSADRVAWVIAVAPFDAVFDTQALDRDRVASIQVHDAALGHSIYSYGAVEAQSPQAWASQMYQLSLGQRQFEITTQFYKPDLFRGLDMVPYIAAAFVLVMTGILAIFAHLRARASYDVKRTGVLLDLARHALEEEVKTRQSLMMDLKQSEHENREVVDSISDIIFETDTSGHLIYVNAAWPRITGFSVPQSKGKNLFTLLHAQDQKKEQEHFDALVKGQKSAYRTFTRLRTIDGTFRAVELSISMLRKTSDGRMHVVGAITDVEERRRAERALGEAEKKYREIVENAAWGIYQMTPEGIYLSANPALVDILGYDNPDELLHKIRNAHEQVYGNERERRTFLREVEVRGSVNNHDVQVYDHTGQGLWVSENIRAVKDETGNVLYFEGSLEDITKRKEADLLLREAKMHSDMANRAKSEFLTNMSHELRTPLNAIIGFSDIIKTEAFGPIGHDSYKEYVQDIYNSGRNLLNIINEILDISKIEVHERELNESVVDMGEVMQSCLALLGNKIHSNQTEILNMLENVPPVVAEDRAMKQIFTNILSNAIKFTPRGGRVTLKHDMSSGGDLLVSVTDNGVGLEPDEIKKALSAFGQVGSSLDGAQAGTGLGLTLVRSLVELHGGRLEIFSQKGMGTTVTVRIPATRVQGGSGVSVDVVHDEAQEKSSGAADALQGHDAGDAFKRS